MRFANGRGSFAAYGFVIALAMAFVGPLKDVPGKKQLTDIYWEQ
jgi:hypothetical protein